jgi:hypothetical protein
LVGDVNYSECKEVASLITPVSNSQNDPVVLVMSASSRFLEALDL